MKLRQRRYCTFNCCFSMLVVMSDLNQNPTSDCGRDVRRFIAITDSPLASDQAALKFVLGHLSRRETQSLYQRVILTVVNSEMKLCVFERHS